MKNVRLKILADLVQGEIVGDDNTLIQGFAPFETADAGDITFLVNANRLEELAATKASAVLVPKSVEKADAALIRVRDPYLASAVIHSYLLAKPFVPKGIHPTAWVGENCTIPDQVTVGANAVVGDRVRLGNRVWIGAGVTIGDDVEIGDDCILKANAVVENGCRLGNRVIIQPGAVIGSDGYGYATDEKGCHLKRPQVGIVRIDDDVEIGANTCIDRAAYGQTWIKSGVKIDNLVQVGHNVVVGENSLLVAQVGIAGSTTLGRNVVVGGQAGISGHIHLDDRVMVAAGGGVHQNLPPGAKVGGIPAIPVKQWGKAVAIYARLPEMYKDLKALAADVRMLKEKKDKELEDPEQ